MNKKLKKLTATVLSLTMLSCYGMTDYSSISAVTEQEETYQSSDDIASSAPIYSTNARNLKDKFHNSFRMGVNVEPFEIISYDDLILRHFNSITPRFTLSPDSILDMEASQELGENVNPQISLSDRAKDLLSFCEENNIAIHGNTFVYHAYTPDWFFRENFRLNASYVSEDVMNQRLENMIKNTFEILKTDYPNLEIYAYDVVSDVFLNDGGGLRDATSSKWAIIYKDDSFIENAFSYARKYAPEGCKLYISDYNEYISEKTNDIYKMAMKLKEKKLIDGIAMQSYLNTSYPSIEIYKTALKKFIHTGLDIQITELNINGPNPSERAEMYKEIFKLAIENSESISSISMYATRDRLISDQESQLFDINGKPNESFDAVMGISFFNTDEPDTPKTEILYGDINNDNDINLSDLTMLSLALVGDAELSSEQKLVADVAYNDSIDIADLALLKQYICKDDVKLGK